MIVKLIKDGIIKKVETKNKTLIEDLIKLGYKEYKEPVKYSNPKK